MRALVACLLIASATRAHADPRLAIRASGTCPSAEAIKRALPNRAPQGGAVELAVEEVAGGVIVRATSATGPLEARLEGSDCAVLASAVAAIADAWFVELAPRAVAAPPMAVVAPSVPGAAPSAPGAAPDAPGADVPPTRTRAPAPRWSLAVGRALVVADRASQSASTRAELGWWIVPKLRLRARVDLGDTATLDYVVGRQATAAVAALGPRFDRGWLWLDAAAGAGLVISRVDLMDSGTQLVRAHGAFAGGASVGIRLGAGGSLRFDIDGLLYPVRDVYTLESSAVARSPRFELAAGLGLEIAFGAQSR